MERYGRLKSGAIPWFKPPEAGEPTIVPGWHWDWREKEWVEDEPIIAKVDLADKPGPMPTRPPGPAILDRVEGWEWSPAKRKWQPLQMPMEKVWGMFERPPMPELPAAHPGVGEVPGWSFDFDKMVWREVRMPMVQIEVEKERPQAPLYPPGPEVPVRLPGWQWDRDRQEWIAVLVATNVVEFEVPRGLPPGAEVTDEQMEIALAGPAEDAFQMLRQAGMTPAEAGEVLATWFVQIRDIRNVGAENIWNLCVVKARFLLMDVKRSTPHLFERPETAGLIYLAIIAFVAAVLFAIIRRDEEPVSLKPPEPTFLLGPDRWFYGKHVGTSITGVLYYSCCFEACPETARHMRGPAWGLTDSIIFPDGFVEEGWYAGKFRKYAWERWVIEYRGFLVRINDGLFRLKRAPLEPGAPPHIYFMMPDDQWCTNFLYYL